MFMRVVEGGEIAVFILYISLGALVAIGGLGLRYFLRQYGTASPSPQPYECGEEPTGSAYTAFRWPFLHIVALLMVLEAEVILMLPWVWSQAFLSSTAFWLELSVVLLPMIGLYFYTIRKGWLSFSEKPRRKQSLPLTYRQLNAYLFSQGRGPSSYSSHPSEAPLPPSPRETAVPQTP